LHKAYVADVFSAENPSNMGLEEIVFDERGKCWKITVGFSRPWDYQKSVVLNMEYKVVKINDDDGKVKEVKIRT